MTPMAALAASLTALAAGLILRLVAPPPRRLRTRVGPYLSPTLAAMGRNGSAGPISSVFGPIIRDVADWVGTRLDRAGSEVTLLKLRQAGWYRGVAEDRMVTAYRLAQLRSLTVGVLVALILGQALDLSMTLRLVLLSLGLLVGATRVKGRLEKAIDARRERMKIEVYTVNQLLAMRVRAGGGVIQAVKATVDRGHGEVVAELAEALRLHRSGWRGPDAFRRIAELTPEPFCSRTYRLLASAEERGADLAGALLSLSEDVRETRRESIKRTATKRRAAMLVPTIAILAPVLILFVAAPLPYLITGWR
ncbi:MAG TPA: type II secretion system F family protein [Acidimicrobiia bacterium]|nr:type II secretion system F family protein [Acidimicrobiia bacterium]